MISSLANQRSATARGLEIPLRRFAGAHASRMIASSRLEGREHAHDWPVLSLYVLGDYHKTFDGGEFAISGPSAVLHGASRAHANRLNEAGLEQVDIEFDPQWLGDAATWSKTGALHCWQGGAIAAAARQLALKWCNSAMSERQLSTATANFVAAAFSDPPARQPGWVASVHEQLAADPALTSIQLAARLDLHPGWLAQAYRAATGEGVRETVQRRRVERATSLLRNSAEQLADIAADCGFCDQSHMNRVFRRLLGRTPAEVRAEGQMMRAAATANPH